MTAATPEQTGPAPELTGAGLLLTPWREARTETPDRVDWAVRDASTGWSSGG